MEILIYYAPTLLFMLSFGLLYVFRPKQINGLIGYRTKKSMKNQENWNFSQKYATKWAFIGFSFVLIAQIILDVLLFHGVYLKEYTPFFVILNILIIVFVMYKTEKKMI